MSELPTKARLGRPFLAINGVDLSRHVLAVTVDRTKREVAVEFFGYGHDKTLKRLVGTTSPATLELRALKQPVSFRNPELGLGAVLLAAWAGRYATFVDCTA
jgi:hypothetical protein